MAQPNRGTKRRCGHCGAAFYDLDRTPIICPKCESKFEPAAVLPRATSRLPRAIRAPVPEIIDVEDVEAFKEDEAASDDEEDDEIVNGEDEVPDEDEADRD